jgi:hypothetical protein
VVSSEDFAAFVRDHPRVLDILHNQIYDRLTEEPTEYGRHEDPGIIAARGLPIAGPASVGPTTMLRSSLRRTA